MTDHIEQPETVHIDLTGMTADRLTEIHAIFLAESHHALDPTSALTRAGIIAGEMVNRFLAGQVPEDNPVIQSTIAALTAAGHMAEGEDLRDVMGD